jgi:hypothetical protein
MIVAYLCSIADKENDVVARAKLDAKRKFGSSPSTNPILLSNGQVEKPSPSDEKESYIRRRIKDDFSRLMCRQTKVFADDISKLEPFQAGFSRKCFPAPNSASRSEANVVTAGTLLVNVLPALAEKEVSRASQLAADALIEALETGSLSPESFFDALAILAENKDILVGSDKILAQLFSRSSSSGNTKVLRTSSGANSKLFATTNGPFIIYNTIENTDRTTPTSSRYSHRSAAVTTSVAGRASPRDHNLTPKMLGVSEISTRPQSHTSTSVSPRTSPTKALKMIQPSKLRGSVSFAKSPSPLSKRIKLTSDHVSVAHGPEKMDCAPTSGLAGQKTSMNEYHPVQLLPLAGTTGDQQHPQGEINDGLVKNLLEWALMAGQEESDNDSLLDGQDADVANGVAEVDALPSDQPSLKTQCLAQHSSNLPTLLKATAYGHNQTSPNISTSAASPQEIAIFSRLIEQLPTSKANLNRKQIERIGTLYDEIARGPRFERAKELGLYYPEIPRPFADRDGWRFTGLTNQFGEEIVEIDRQIWVYPVQPGQHIQQPLQRLKRKAQIEQETIFGFPPAAGYGNGPPKKRSRLENQDEENVAYETVMFNVRKAAKIRGLPCDRSLSWEQLVALIKTFDASYDINFEEVDSGAVTQNHDEPADSPSSRVEASEVSEVEIDSDDDSDYEPDPVVKNHVGRAWAGSNGAQTSSFAAAGGRRGSLRKLRDRPSSSPSSAHGNQIRGLGSSANFDVSEIPPGPLPKLT